MAKIFKNICPCKNCDSRCSECHSNCEKYNEWRESGIEQKEPLLTNGAVRRRMIKKYYLRKANQ